MALSCGLQFHQHPPKQLVTSRELRQQPEISSLSTPCTCSCRCRSVTCNICMRKSTPCLKHMFVDKPIQPLLLPQQEQNREVQQLVSSRLSSSRLLPQQQQNQNGDAQQHSVSSRLGSSAVAPNSSDLNMANCEVRSNSWNHKWSKISNLHFSQY